MMRRSLFAACCSLVLALALLADRSAGEEVRTWTDKSGKFSVEAEFVEILEGKVRLKLKDGKTVGLPLAKLSEADRAYLKELLRKRREEAEGGAAGGPAVRPRPGLRNREESPWSVGDRVQYREGFTYVPATVVSVEGFHVVIHLDGKPEGETERTPTNWIEPLSESTAAAAAWAWNPPSMKPALKPDYAGVKRPGLNPAAGSAVTPDPGAAGEGTPAASVGLGGKFAYYEKLLTFDAALAGAPIAVVGYAGGKEFKDISTRIQVVDLKDAALMGNFSGPAKLQSVHASPSGKRLVTLCEADSMSNAPAFMDVWDLGEQGLVHVATWQPYATAGANRGGIEKVLWVDDERLITRGGEGTAVLWQVDGAKAVYELKAPSSGIALSPGRKQLACATPTGVDVYAVDDGAHLAHLPAASGVGPIAFSPSGAQIVLSGSLGVEVIDVTGKQPARQFYISGVSDGFQWLDEQYLLAGNGMLVDAAKLVAVWRYERTGLGELDQGRFWYVTGDDDNHALMNVLLPHEAARQAAGAIDAQHVMAVEPGMAVTIDVDLGDATATPEGVARLTQAAEAAGLRVEPGQPIVLTARTRGGESQEMKYRKMFGGNEEVTMSVPTRYYDVELLVGGEKVWSGGSFQGAPGMPSIEEGESIQAAVSRQMGVSATYLPAVLPMRIVKAEFQKPRGESKLTERGVE